MHQNDFFYFKKLFLRPTHQNDSKHTNKINFFEFWKNTVCTALKPLYNNLINHPFVFNG
jgi:hypothetical protein